MIMLNFVSGVQAMKTVFIGIVFLHGIIHILGFVKAFGIKEVRELKMPVSKPAGIAWLVSALLFLIFTLLFYLDSGAAWMAGLAAAGLSQFLIFLSWKDARFGTLVNLPVFLVALVDCGSYLMNREFKSRVADDFAVNSAAPDGVLTEADIAGLPLCVQKYLHYTRSVGKPKVVNFRAVFTGRMRSAPAGPYMKMKSVQYNFYGQPSRYFFMSARKTGLPVRGLHIYRNQTATFRVKLLNWFTVVDASGEKMNRAETVTLLNDMCFIAPASLIDKRIAWENRNDTTVTAIYTNGAIRVSAVLFFNGRGQLVNFYSKDRYHTDGKTYENYPWSTPVSDYRQLNGYLLPGKASLVYHKPSGDFTYGELQYESVNYNLSEFQGSTADK